MIGQGRSIRTNRKPGIIKKRLYRQLLCNISRFKVVGSRSAPQLKHLPSWRVWMEEVLMNKVYQGQWVIAAHNSAMDMQNKQIRQPGSQTEPLRLSGIALDTGQKQSLVSINCLLDHCFIVRVLPLSFIHNVWKKKDWFYFEKTGVMNDWV